MISFQIKPFGELSSTEVYAVLQLRAEVFVVEQNCPYQDVDGKDEKAFHLLGLKNGILVAYARIFKPGDYFDEASIGRVVVKKTERKFGYGHQLMAFANAFVLEELNCTAIKISAQQYLEKFYNTHGYQRIGEGYLEDDIPHIAMLKIWN